MQTEEFKKFILDNKDNEDLRAIVGEVFNPTLDDALKRFEGSKDYKSFVDRVQTKGIEAYMKNHGEELEQKAETLAEEKLKSMQEKDPKDLELEKLRKEFESERRERLTEKNKNTTLSLLQENKLPAGFADFIVTADDEKTKERFDSFSNLMSTVIEETQKQALSGVKTDVPNNTSMGANGEPGADATKEEWLEYYKSQKK